MKKKKWRIISIVTLIMALIFLGVAGWQENSKKKSEETYENMRKDNAMLEQNADDKVEKPEKEVENIVKVTEEAVETETPSELEIPIDFESLKETNPDIYAWISIPGTVIDYPILQSPNNNTFYLDHAVDKSYSFPGSIYSENFNEKDFSDYLTVLYGHNMRNGSMFAGLHKFRDSNYLHQNDQVIIYTPDKILHYTIFAAYRFDNRHLLYAYNWGKTREDREKFLNEMKDYRSMNAYIDPDSSVDADDHILTLSTCDSAGHEYRFLVQAYLTRTEK